MDLVPDLLDAVDALDQPDPAVRAGADLLGAWDHRMDPESEAALLFECWMEHLRWHIQWHVRQREVEPWARLREWTIAALPAESPFWGEGGRDAALVRALARAIERIDEEGWTVLRDRQTTAWIEHPAGDLLEQFRYPEHPVGGSRYTVNRFGRWTGSGYRIVVAVGDDPETVIAGGNGGDPTSEHYDDQLEAWLAGEYSRQSLTPEGSVSISFVPEL